MSGLAGESLCITRGIKKALPPLGGASVVTVIELCLGGIGIYASSCEFVERASEDVAKFNGVRKRKGRLSGLP